MSASVHKRAFLRPPDDVRFTRKSGRRNRTDTPTYRQKKTRLDSAFSRRDFFRKELNRTKIEF
jgi:hypothetical protein